MRNGAAARHDRRARRREARLRLRRDERARPLLLARATTTSSARRSPTATTRSPGCRRSHGPTARSARSAARPRRNGSWRVAAQGNPAFDAMIPQGFGAGVGRVAPYYEQGNWYRGGAVQMLFIAWLYGEQNQVRPMFPPNTSQEDLIRASKIVRPRAADAAGGLVEGAAASARRWTSSRRSDGPAGHLRRSTCRSPPAAR